MTKDRKADIDARIEEAIYIATRLSETFQFRSTDALTAAIIDSLARADAAEVAATALHNHAQRIAD